MRPDLAIFISVCAIGMFGLLAVFAQLRFQKEKTYNAVFTNVSGLAEGNFVRIAGVEVGKVKHVSVEDDAKREDAIAVVTFSADDTVALTDGTKVLVRYDNLIGGRYLELQQGAGSTKTLHPGDTIAIDRTAPALDVDALIGGFRPLFRALNPEQVNTLSGQLIAAFQGQGATIGSFLAQTAALTNTLANRDDLVRQVIDNLNTVLGSLGQQSKNFGDAIDSLALLINALNSHKVDITNGLAYSNEAAGTLADLLQQARPPAQNVVNQTDRTAGIVMADHDYVDNLINTLPDAYQALSRQGLYGDFFSFYLCDVFLKLNGKGGQPVYVKVVGQSSGRCTPK